MRGHVVYIALFFLLYSCNNSPQNIPFPKPPSQFFKPKSTPVKFAKPVSLIPVVYTGDRLPKPEEKKLSEPSISALADFEKKRLAPDTLHLTGVQTNKLFRNVSKSVPGKEKSGVPERVRALPAQMRDNSMTSISYYNQENGLPGNLPESIIMDHAGRMWIGTDAGLCMFDGHVWAIYTTDQGLSSNVVVSVLEDRQHNIWVGTSGGGVNMLSRDRNTIKKWGTKEGLSSTDVKSMTEDHSGNIWVGTYGGGINVINASRNTVEHLGKKQGLSGDLVWTVFCDSKGFIWTGIHQSDLCKIDSKTNRVEVYAKQYSINTNSVFAIDEDKKGRVWVGTNGGGVFGLLPGDTNVLHYGWNTGLASADVFSLLCDSQDNLWIGTYRSGITLLHANGKARYLGTDQGLSNITVTELMEDNRGNVWVGTNGGGLNCIQMRSGLFRHFTARHGLTDYYGYALFEDKKHNLWIGTNGGGPNVIDSAKNIRCYRDAMVYTVQGGIYQDARGSMWLSNFMPAITEIDSAGVVKHYKAPQGITKGNSWTIRGDAKGYIWANMLSAALYVICPGRDSILFIDSTMGLSASNINDIYIDRSNHVWVATSGSGVQVIDPERKTVRTMNKETGLSDNNVLGFYEDEEGQMWIGTDGRGIDILNKERNAKINIGIGQGMPHNRIQSFVKDNDRVWVGTGHGLACITKKNGAFFIKRIGRSEGWKSVDFFTASAIRRYDGTLVWGVGDGITFYNPGNLEDKKPPVTFISTVNIMQKELNWHFESKKNAFAKKNNIEFKGVTGDYFLPAALVVPFSQNHLTFGFTGIAFGQEPGIRYRYILDGLDGKWSSITNENKADYRNIPPGNYVFKVASCNASGYWSKPVEFAFTVNPPWWRTVWAYSSYAVIFVSFIVGFNRIRTRSLLKRQRQLEETVKERTAEIEQKRQEIIDSINYAARIQQALLPSEKLVDRNLKRLGKDKDR
ncbi:MAG TPA: two-component regulator propeller domain-containing protein [Flavobacteriales bacterium]|nr:two-component regulator propeller domain-containing protein [Flavobacteriales bacterium]